MAASLKKESGWLTRLERIDRRVIYLLVLLSILVPVFLTKTALEPPVFDTSRRFYDAIEALESRDDQIVFVALDWSPTVVSENGPQSEMLLEHLMRRRIKFALISIDASSEPFLINYPMEAARRLEQRTGERWEYGKDWVNLGFRPSLPLLLQQLVKAADIRTVLKVDANGTRLTDIPCMRQIRRFDQVPLLAEITSWFGHLSIWIQFFQSGTHRPVIIQGSGSYMIVDVYNYLDSGQISGLLEGAAGAAYYSRLLGYTRQNPTSAMLNMTGLSLAQLTIMALVVLGNVGMLLRKWAERSGK